MLEDEQLRTLDVAASHLGVPTKDLRTYLQKQRPKGSVQIPNKPGGQWHVQSALLTQLSFAGASGLDVQLTPITDEILDALPWSPWVPFEQAADAAPAVPGVYMARVQGSHEKPPVYIGEASERNGKGLRGRLKSYSLGKSANTGLGKHAMDQALADPQWLRQLVTNAEAGEAESIDRVARAAIDRLQIEVRWVPCIHRKAAMVLEAALMTKYAATLWNVNDDSAHSDS